MQNRLKNIVFTAMLLLPLMTTWSLVVAEGPLQESKDLQQQTQDAAIRSQQRVNELDDETRRLLDEFRAVTEEHRQLEQYNEQLARVIQNQSEALRSVDAQLNEVQHTQQSIFPLMTRMVAALEQFVALDLPFLMQERNDRSKALGEVLDDAEVILPEKYRRVMEAYQIELDYGRTIDTHQDTIVLDGKELTVNIFRLGRLGLYCLTLDNQQAGMYDRNAREWVGISNAYVKSLEYGIRMARKQVPPDLIEIPIPVPGTSGMGEKT